MIEIFLIIFFILIILDEIITEWFIYYAYGEEANPLMKNKTVRIISVPIEIILFISLSIISSIIHEIVLNVFMINLIIMILFLTIIIISNVKGSLKEKKLLN